MKSSPFEYICLCIVVCHLSHIKKHFIDLALNSVAPVSKIKYTIPNQSYGANKKDSKILNIKICLISLHLETIMKRS